jgi:hypothetical protein
MRSYVCRFVPFLLPAALLLFAPVLAATIFGNIRGIVHDAQHRPIAGVEVALKSSTSAWSQTVQTDQTGQFQFNAVAVGEYTINITQPGFRDVSEHIIVTSGSSPVLHFELDCQCTQSDRYQPTASSRRCHILFNHTNLVTH